MIIACIKDMTIFMVVLFIGVFAFADAFQSIREVHILSGAIEVEEIPIDANNYERYWKSYITSW